MTRILSCFFFCCLFLVSCNKSKDSEASSGRAITDAKPLVEDSVNSPQLPPLVEPTLPQAEAPAPVTPPAKPPVSTPVNSLPAEAYTFETNVTFFSVTATQEAKFQKALEIIKEVVATDEFRTKVLNHTYAGKKTYVDNGGLTNEQIYQKILDGAERLHPSKDNQMDLEVELYTAYTSTVGYTYPNSKRIWVNTKYFNSYTAAGVAHNLFHEWLHKLGFTHAASYSKSRDYSVPYAIGDMVGDIGKDFL